VARTKKAAPCGAAGWWADKPGSVGLTGVRRLVIYLVRASPRASSGQPGDVGEPGRLSLPIGPCTGWGLPSYPCYQRYWCALTAPFHPYARPPSRAARGLLSVALAVALHAQPLAGTLPYGARTFLDTRARQYPERGPSQGPRVASAVRASRPDRPHSHRPG